MLGVCGDPQHLLYTFPPVVNTPLSLQTGVCIITNATVCKFAPTKTREKMKCLSSDTYPVP